MKFVAQSKFGALSVFLLSLLVSGITVAASSDDEFEQQVLDQYLFACLTVTPPPGVTFADWAVFCAELGGFYSSGGSGGGVATTNNFGTSGAVNRSSNNTAGVVKGNIKERLEELEDEKDNGGASADGNSSWGLLVAPQFGETDREETDNENGFESDLNGLMLGLDYRFSDEFVLGFAAGMLEDDAVFDNNNGTLKTDSNSLTIYATWAPMDVAYLSGYVGATQMDYESLRLITVGNAPAETATGDMEGSQVLAGISGGYDWLISDFSVGVFANIDYVETTIDQYDEAGSSTVRLQYFEQEITSLTSSIGLRAEQYINVSDGDILVPNVRVSFVREHDDDARQIDTALLLTGDSFTINTDPPDRNYILFGLGITAASGNNQLYIDFEQQTGHEFLDTWVVTSGVLLEF